MSFLFQFFCCCSRRIFRVQSLHFKNRIHESNHINSMGSMNAQTACVSHFLDPKRNPFQAGVFSSLRFVLRSSKSKQQNNKMPRATDLRAAFQNSSPAARYRVGGGALAPGWKGLPSSGGSGSPTFSGSYDHDHAKFIRFKKPCCCVRGWGWWRRGV